MPSSTSTWYCVQIAGRAVAAPDAERTRRHLGSLLACRRRRPRDRRASRRRSTASSLGGSRPLLLAPRPCDRRTPAGRRRCTGPTRRARRGNRRGCARRGSPRAPVPARVTASAVMSSEPRAIASCQPGLYWAAPGALTPSTSRLDRLQLDQRRLEFLALAHDVDVAVHDLLQVLGDDVGIEPFGPVERDRWRVSPPPRPGACRSSVGVTAPARSRPRRHRPGARRRAGRRASCRPNGWRRACRRCTRRRRTGPGTVDCWVSACTRIPPMK